MTNEVLETIKRRRSVRAFTEVQVDREMLQAILEAGIYAPYAMPDARHIAAVQDAALIDRLNTEAKAIAVQFQIPGLVEIAQKESYSCVHHAPTVIIISGNEATISPETDCSAAAQNMLLAAESLGLGACWVFFMTLAFHSPEAAALREALQIPDGFKPAVSIALGHKKDASVRIMERSMELVSIV